MGSSSGFWGGSEPCFGVGGVWGWIRKVEKLARKKSELWESLAPGEGGLKQWGSLGAGWL